MQKITIKPTKVTDPLTELSDCLKKVAEGDFSVRVKHSGTDELGQLANNFNMMVDKLSQMEYLRKDFISNVSHEFKTPVSAIQGFVELICDPAVTKEDRDTYASLLVEETKRLNRLSSNMLHLSRLDSDLVSITPLDYRLDEQIRRVLVLLEYAWQKKNLKLWLDMDQVVYRGDKELMSQVWINLIENAIKFSDEGGKISLSCHTQEKGIVVSISNGGKIISQGDMNRIYEKFFQGDRSHNAGGNGLGLSIVKRILDLSGGQIDFSSSVSGKNTFTVCLK